MGRRVRPAAGVNGRMLMDQAAHHQVQIPAGVLATAAVAALVTGKQGR
jgi:hypothetical protein